MKHYTYNAVQGLVTYDVLEQAPGEPEGCAFVRVSSEHVLGFVGPGLDGDADLLDVPWRENLLAVARFIFEKTGDQPECITVIKQATVRSPSPKFSTNLPRYEPAPALGGERAEGQA